MNVWHASRLHYISYTIIFSYEEVYSKTAVISQLNHTPGCLLCAQAKRRAINSPEWMEYLSTLKTTDFPSSNDAWAIYLLPLRGKCYVHPE